MRKLVALLFGLLLASGALAFDSDETIDLYSALTANPDFSIFTQLLTDLGIAEALQTGEAYTVFAISNDTFESYQEETGIDLTADREVLVQILEMHVVQGRFSVLELRDAEAGSVVTLSGAPLAVTLEADGITVGGANLVSTDVDNSYANGVIHVVSEVMMPVAQN
jgi:uncharacterized surface protein with fasciclin (FAS1) repeats